MDENKLKVLQKIDYRRAPCCSLCEYGDFQPNRDFGTCKLFTYEHKKHNESSRQLSIHRLGICDGSGYMEQVHPEFFDKI